MLIGSVRFVALSWLLFQHEVMERGDVAGDWRQFSPNCKGKIDFRLGEERLGDVLAQRMLLL